MSFLTASFRQRPSVVALAILTIIALTASPDAYGQSFSEVAVPTNPVYVYVGPGTYYEHDEFVRAGQQKIRFDNNTEIFTMMQVRVDGGPWQTIYQGPGTNGWVQWDNTPSVPGRYLVEFVDTTQPYTFYLNVMPAADRAFRDSEVIVGRQSEILLWKGGADAFDKPVLLVEGIDADNDDAPATYYALGQALFAQTRTLDGDVLILDFADGGRDLAQNAQVVRRAIQIVRSS